MRASPTLSRKPALSRLLAYGRNYRGKIWQAVSFSVINKIFDLAPPAIIGVAVDVVVRQQDSLLADWGVVEPFQQLLLLTAASVGIWVFESVFQYAYATTWRNLAQRLQHDLRLDAYDRLQQMEMSYFEERSTGGLMSVLSDDINQLERFLDVGANEIVQVSITVVAIGCAFFFLAPNVAWLAVLPIPFILWGSIAFQGTLEPRYADVREKVSLLNGQLANNLTGIATIKSFTAERYELGRIRRESDAYRHSNRRAIALSAAFEPLIRMVVLVGFATILLYGGIEAVRGNLAAGAYSTMVYMTQRLLWPLTRLGQTLDLYQRAMASARRVMALLDTPIAIHSGEKSLPADRVAGEIRLENVTFAYRDRPPALENLSLHVPAGQTIGIVGPTGSGKSTIVKLLLRFYEVQSGEIVLDNVRTQDIVLADLRQAIGLVSQDTFLFHGTVAENIAYGTFDAKREDIAAAAALAEAHAFIQDLPQGYDTIVGERGQKLSGGQRQRLAIARAILKNPPILILDEATSSVDNETEAAIQRSLDRITQNRTTIAIAHRLSTIRHADCIYVLDGGRIVERGTHEALLEQRGAYANLWAVQTGDRAKPYDASPIV